MNIVNGKESEVLEMLHGYGLCDYEAKAYFALLAVGESKAWDVARKAAIPPSKVHQTLGRLVERGFVEMYGEERPAMYKALALKETTEKVVALRNREIARVRRNRAKLSRVLEAVAPIHRQYETYRLFAPRYRTWKKTELHIDDREPIISDKVLIYSSHRKEPLDKTHTIHPRYL